MITAYAFNDLGGPGVRVNVVNLIPGTVPDEVLRIVGDESGVHHFHWAPLVPGVTMEPTLQVPPEMARALYEALGRHFQETESTCVLPALTGQPE